MLDPFNPDSGAFAQNIREIVGIDDTELRGSLRTVGWNEELPAIVDERGVTIVGHRRLKIAAELGIAPVIKTIEFGIGDTADKRRAELAIASNLGAAPMTKKDRKRVAERLYPVLTMEQIANMIGVTAMTVSNDLRGFKADLKPYRPQGGRPRLSPQIDKTVAAITQKMEAGEKISRSAIQKELGVSGGTYTSALTLAKSKAIEPRDSVSVLDLPQKVPTTRARKTLPVSKIVVPDESDAETPEQVEYRMFLWEALGKVESARKTFKRIDLMGIASPSYLNEMVAAAKEVSESWSKIAERISLLLSKV
jgi:ParB-like chromosome segregation protein Spo0J